MTAVLQLSGEERLPAIGAGQAAGRGWQRALGKAEAAAWFLGPVAQHTRMAETASSSQALASRAPSVLMGDRLPGKSVPPIVAAGSTAAVANGALWTSSVGTEATLGGGTEAIQPVTTVDPGASGGSSLPAGNAGAPASRQRVVVDSPFRGDPAHAPQRLLLPVAMERSLHVHVERQIDGLHVWFGVQSPGAVAMVRHLDVTTLQRALGSKVASVVCNGETLHGAAPMPHCVSPPGPAGHNQEP
jgi:hypothetical protein